MAKFRKFRLGDDDHAIVDCIYSSALEPETFAQLLDNWDDRLRRAGYSAETLSLFSNLLFEKHLARAVNLADRLAPASNSARSQAAVAGIHAAAMIASRTGEIVAVNPAAEAVFAVRAGMNIADLPLDPAGLDQFRDSIARVVGAVDDRQDLLRISSRSSEKHVFVLLRPFEEADGDRRVLIVTTEQAWSDNATGVLQRSFGITSAEIGILRALLSGATVAEIAARTGRSAATVRSQIHSLLGKTGTRTQAELLRIVNAFLQATAIAPAAGPAAVPPRPSHNPFESLRLPDGRRMDFMRIGDPHGIGFLWLPGNLAQCRLPAVAERALKTLGLAMVVPVKAGYAKDCRTPAA
jgi:DNA-binding CsgD family transcriptional regulator